MMEFHSMICPADQRGWKLVCVKFGRQVEMKAVMQQCAQKK